MKRNGHLLAFALLCIPCESLARGSLHLDATFYVVFVFISVYIVMRFWLLILSLPFFVMLFASNFIGLRINDDLLGFSGGGFWYSYGIVFVILLRTLPNFSTFELILITTVVQFLIWFGIAVAMQLAENRRNSRQR